MLDTARARRAHEQVEAVLGGDFDAGAYRRLCFTLPGLICTQGLGPALHHMAMRNHREARRLIGDLSEQAHGSRLVPGAGWRDLMESSRSTDPVHIQRLTRDVLQSLEWSRRFAKTVLTANEEADA